MKIIRPILVGPVLAALLLAAVFGATPALAGGMVGNGDPTTCTEANFDLAFAGGGLITFNCGPAPKTIIFTNQKLVVTADATIDGGGLITLSGANSTRLFGVGGGHALTLKNIVLEKGNSGSGLGGAVLVSASSLILDHATIQNSHTDNQPGGAIQAAGGAITLTNNSLIQNNNGYNYGAINDTGSFAMDHSIIRDNTATFGGGGLCLGGLTTIDHSQIYSNTANGAGGGGGLYLTAPSRATLTDSQVYSNTALADSASGGGIENMGTLTLTRTSLNGNSGFAGGGLSNETSGQAALDHVTVSGNTASSYSGGLNTEGVLTLTNTSLVGNRVPNSAEGGALGAGGSAKTTITATTFTGNSAGSGGAIASAGGPLTLINVTLSGNTAVGSGGGLLASYGVATLLNVTFNGNSAATGGAIYLSAPGAGDTLTLKNTLVADSPAGGNCYVSLGSLTDIASAGFNLSTDGTCSAYFNQGGDQNGQPARLFPLAGNGGPVRTLLPQHDSLAIDNGTGLGCPASDARGLARPVGGGCDIGAVEAQANDLVWPVFLALARR